MNLLPILALLVVPHGPVQQDQNVPNPELLKVALQRLDEMKDPEVVANKDTLQAVLERYYLHRATMKDSEFELVEAFLQAASEGRGGGGKLFQMLHSHAAPAADPAPKPAPKPAPAKHGKKPPVVVHPKPAPARASSLAFTSVVRRAPGGSDLGVVQLNNKGLRTTLVEIYTGAGMNVGKRASIIADRFDHLSKIDPLWWMKLKVATAGGATIVSSPRAAQGIVVTADAPFAKACGTDPAGLARMLIRKIRDGIEPSQGGARGELDDPETMLTNAVDARQHGDELAATDKKGAIAAYEEAITAWPAYNVPYLRIAALQVELKDKTAAKDALNRGLAVESMKEEDKAELKAALAKLG